MEGLVVDGELDCYKDVYEMTLAVISIIQRDILVPCYDLKWPAYCCPFVRID